MPGSSSVDEEARSRWLQGVTIMAAAVKATLGPKGRNVRHRQTVPAPHDPRTASPSPGDRAEGQVQNMGAQMVREVARRPPTSPVTAPTTATVLAHAISRGPQERDRRRHPMGLNRGIEAAVDAW